MLHKRHRVVILSGTHLAHTRTEARDGQDDDIADLLGQGHAGEISPGDVPIASGHVKVPLVVHVVEDDIGPHSGPGELNDVLVLERPQQASLLLLQGQERDVGYDLAQDRVAGFGLDGPLAELDAARVPLRPVGPVRISLDAHDQAHGLLGDARREPVNGRPDGEGVDVGVDAAPSQQDQVAEEISLQDREGEGIVGFEDLGNGRVQVSEEVDGDLVSNDLVDEARVHLRPARLRGAEVLSKVAGRGGVLPRLPDVGGELGLDIVWELERELLPQRCAGEVVD